MLKGFKTELKLNNQQRVILAKQVGVARHADNWGLALCQNILSHNRENPLELLKFPTAIDLHKLLVAMVKSENPWYYKVSKCAPQYALKHLVVDRFYPSSKKCSNCGVVKESLSLSQRVFHCEACNFEADRDFHASVNLEKAVSSTVTASRLDSADTARVTEEKNVSDC